MHTAGQKALGQLAAGGDDDDQFVGVCLGGVLQHLVVAGAFVGVGLVGNDDIGVEGVHFLKGRRQGVDADVPILAHIAGDAALHVVVNDPQAALLVVVHGQLAAPQVVFQEIKALQGLLQGAAHLVYLGCAAPLIQCQGPRQGRRKGGLDVLPGDKVQNLLEAPFLGTADVKAHDVEDHELVVWKQQERRAAQRRGVQKLALLVADGGLNDGDDLRRRLRPEFPLGVFQIPEIPLAGQPDILAGADRSAEHAIHIAVHGRLEV